MPELPAGPVALPGRPDERPARGRLHRGRDGQAHPRRGLDARVCGAGQRRRHRARAGLSRRRTHHRAKVALIIGVTHHGRSRFQHPASARHHGAPAVAHPPVSFSDGADVRDSVRADARLLALGRGAGPRSRPGGAADRQARGRHVALEPIGNYAVQPTFSDGHESGIYSWDYLYFLGSQQGELWRRYQARLTEAGVDGTPPWQARPSRQALAPADITIIERKAAPARTSPCRICFASRAPSRKSARTFRAHRVRPPHEGDGPRRGNRGVSGRYGGLLSPLRRRLLREVAWRAGRPAAVPGRQDPHGVRPR